MYKEIVPAYVVISLFIVMLWLVTSPGWYYFISELLNPNEDNPSTVARLVYQLMPGYAFFIISSLNGSVFYAKGKVRKIFLNRFQIYPDSIIYKARQTVIHTFYFRFNTWHCQLRLPPFSWLGFSCLSFLASFSLKLRSLQGFLKQIWYLDLSCRAFCLEESFDS